MSRKSAAGRGQRTSADYLFEWSLPLPKDARAWLQDKANATTALCPRNASQVVTEHLRRAAADGQGKTMNLNGKKVTSSLFRDTLDALLRSLVASGKNGLTFRDTMDHTYRTAKASIRVLKRNGKGRAENKMKMPEPCLWYQVKRNIAYS
jgi:hypothetical protein